MDNVISSTFALKRHALTQVFAPKTKSCSINNTCNQKSATCTFTSSCNMGSNCNINNKCSDSNTCTITNHGKSGSITNSLAHCITGTVTNNCSKCHSNNNCNCKTCSVT